ncbi:MAG: TRAM domain-containing protein [Desulfurococcaceae archaeon]
MSRDRNRKDPYNIDVYRYSIYPRIRYEDGNEIRAGRQLVLDIYDVDEKGRGVASYRGKKIIVPNAMLGSKVRVRIVKVEKDYAIAHIVSILRETDNVY